MTFSLNMNCRPGCGACCITISISSPIAGMPAGKPAGIRCLHLTEDYRCAIFEHSERPEVCKSFMAEEVICSHSRDEAMKILYQLENGTT